MTKLPSPGSASCLLQSLVMTSVKIVPDDSSFAAELEAAESKLVVVDFTAEWCGPCKRIAPFYDELSNKFPRAVFLKVDVDVCTETAGAHSVTAMPTFMGGEGGDVEQLHRRHFPPLLSPIFCCFRVHLLQRLLPILLLLLGNNANRQPK